MKKRIIIIVVVCAVAAGVLFGFQIPQRIGFAAEAAHYLAEKYGESYHVVDCVYSRMGYTDSHYDILGNGSTTDYPDLAIFGRGESSIAVHRRDGKFCDDGQIAELGYIIAEHFSEKCGIEISYAELRSCANGNISDEMPTQLVQRFNMRLNKDNIEEILLDFADTQKYLELALYIPDKYADHRELTAEVSKGLWNITGNEGFSRVRYFLYPAEQELIINSTLGAWQDKNIGSYEYRALDFPYYYVSNPYMYSDFSLKGCAYYGQPVNTITGAGWCVLDRGYGATVGNTPYETYGDWQFFSIFGE